MYPRRLIKEYQKLTKDNSDQIMVHFSLDKPENMYNWTITMKGPIGTPYEDGIFIIDCNFPDEYPFKPPKIKFLTEILHINCDKDGKICLEILSNYWSPALNIYTVMKTIIEIMINPNIEDCINNDIGEIYKRAVEVYDDFLIYITHA